jgi:Raf kinase inhibitor-like YbhB/YbcL family protein
MANPIGAALRRVRAGHHKLAWEDPGLQAPQNFQLTSPSFHHGAPIPQRHAGKRIGGKDLSPELAWTTPPARTVELALIMQDPDAPLPRPVMHISTLGIGHALSGLPEGGLADGSPVPGLKHGKNMGRLGYFGPTPVPSHGPHYYVFQLFALDQPADLPPGSTGKQALAAIRGHVIGRARLDGTYEVP